MRQSLKSTLKTQKAPRNVRKTAGIAMSRCGLATFTLIFLPADRAGAITPEAREVLDILDARIQSAEAGEGALDLFLETLGPGDGCRDWDGDSFWKRDPDLREAVEAACPDLGRGSRRGAHAPKGRLRLIQSMRPLDEEDPTPPPELSARLSAPLSVPRAGSLSGADRPSIGGEGTLAGGIPLRRRLWLGRHDFTLQAGRLAFGPETASPGPGRSAALRGEGIPHLAFITGKRSFPGSGGLSGVEGPWEARSPALDGLALTTRRPLWQAGGFASWNRLGGTADERDRRDALVYSLAAGGSREGASGRARDGWGWSMQGARLRLEYVGEEGDPEAADIWLAGAAMERRISAGADAEPAGLRAGFALSHLEGEPYGAYGELEWQGGKPDRSFLGLHQATTRWANPLASVRALTRDTVQGGWILPGRGEGGLVLRTRLDILRAGSCRMAAISGGEADWSLADGFLAGAGRFTLSLGAGAWEARTSHGMSWRAQASTSYAPPLLSAQSLIWRQGPWRAEAVLSRGRSSKPEAWPLRLMTARNGRQGNRWTVEAWSGDLRDPLAVVRLSCHQSWLLGKAVRILQALALPMERGDLQKGLDYRMGMEIGGF